MSSRELSEILAAYKLRLLRKNEFLLYQSEVSHNYSFSEQGLRAFTLDPDGLVAGLPSQIHTKLVSCQMAGGYLAFGKGGAA